jgi:hypothetical protein
MIGRVIVTPNSNNMYNFLRDTGFIVNKNRLFLYLSYYIPFEIDKVPVDNLFNNVVIKREPKTSR